MACPRPSSGRPTPGCRGPGRLVIGESVLWAAAPLRPFLCSRKALEAATGGEGLGGPGRAGARPGLGGKNRVGVQIVTFGTECQQTWIKPLSSAGHCSNY